MDVEGEANNEGVSTYCYCYIYSPALRRGAVSGGYLSRNMTVCTQREIRIIFWLKNSYLSKVKSKVVYLTGPTEAHS